MIATPTPAYYRSLVPWSPEGGRVVGWAGPSELEAGLQAARAGQGAEWLARTGAGAARTAAAGGAVAGSAQVASLLTAAGVSTSVPVAGWIVAGGLLAAAGITAIARAHRKRGGGRAGRKAAIAAARKLGEGGRAFAAEYAAYSGKPRSAVIARAKALQGSLATARRARRRHAVADRYNALLYLLQHDAPEGDLGAIQTPVGTIGTSADLNRWTKGQIAKAKAGAPLAEYNRETHSSSLYQGVTNTIGARYKSAYWLAVAARIARSRGLPQAAALLSEAEALHRAAYRESVTRGAHFAGSEGGPILAGAAAKAKAAGVASVAAILARIASPRMERARKQVRHETGPGGLLLDPIVKTGQDLVPGGAGETPWWLYGLFGLAGLFGVVVVARAVR